MKGFLFGIFFTLAVLVMGGLWSLWRGYVDFAADHPPSFLERKLAMAAVDASTDRRAPNVRNPVPPTEENLVAGAKLYLNHCAGCHGLPSNADSQFARSFDPPVPGFFKEAPDMAENQNFYVIEHGIRWTGMPAWNKTLSDTGAWQIVTFLSHVRQLPAGASKELTPSVSATK
jgi:mono/diheme cytochrome c family protein